ncbi:hypothetical protein BOTBODRAFT_29096 [Botryobasidium botryosum FD-172 SS1]|uniref:Uncharacterized protein n=1 Tax=Botryobasidium botryosum (strain FD-172 SS1) TaxID=930990 RepID=A0A067N3L2_BOTB1|nr:hypothetical protein BOTBODRAFT_29096 [Botryobasidium botryosum FD-172 SS1]
MCSIVEFTPISELERAYNARYGRRTSCYQEFADPMDYFASRVPLFELSVPSHPSSSPSSVATSLDAPPTATKPEPEPQSDLEAAYNARYGRKGGRYEDFADPLEYFASRVPLFEASVPSTPVSSTSPSLPPTALPACATFAAVEAEIAVESELVRAYNSRYARKASCYEDFADPLEYFASEAMIERAPLFESSTPSIPTITALPAAKPVIDIQVLPLAIDEMPEVEWWSLRPDSDAHDALMQRPAQEMYEKGDLEAMGVEQALLPLHAPQSFEPKVLLPTPTPLALVGSLTVLTIVLTAFASLQTPQLRVSAPRVWDHFAVFLTNLFVLCRALVKSSWRSITAASPRIPAAQGQQQLPYFRAPVSLTRAVSLGSNNNNSHLSFLSQPSLSFARSWWTTVRPAPLPLPISSPSVSSFPSSFTPSSYSLLRGLLPYNLATPLRTIFGRSWRNALVSSSVPVSLHARHFC